MRLVTKQVVIAELLERMKAMVPRGSPGWPIDHFEHLRDLIDRIEALGPNPHPDKVQAKIDYYRRRGYSPPVNSQVNKLFCDHCSQDVPAVVMISFRYFDFAEAYEHLQLCGDCIMHAFKVHEGDLEQ